LQKHLSLTYSIVLITIDVLIPSILLIIIDALINDVEKIYNCEMFITISVPKFKRIENT